MTTFEFYVLSFPEMTMYYNNQHDIGIILYNKGHNSNSKSELILDKDFTLWVERVLIKYYIQNTG